MTKPLPKSGFVRVEINLQRYVPSGVYYARIRVGGELIKKSLNTTSLTVARLRLHDFSKDERAKSDTRRRAGRTEDGSITVRGATDLFLADAKQKAATLVIKPRTYDNYLETIKSIEKTWPDLMTRDVRDITPKQCQEWAKKLRQFGTQFKNPGAKKARTGISAQRFNGAVYRLRSIFEIAVNDHHIYVNPVKGDMMTVRPKHLVLPSKSQFKQIITAIKTAKGRFSRACADMVAFLAYSGCRISEARRVLFSHIDWAATASLCMGIPSPGPRTGRSAPFP